MNESTTPIHCRPEALVIVDQALATGIFYQDELRDACRDPWAEAFPVTGECITASEGRNWIDEPDAFPEKRALREHLRAELRASRRGSWALIRRPWKDDDRVSWSAFYTGGDGTDHEPQTSHLPGEPAQGDMVAAMVGMEIYCTREELELRKRLERSRQALAEHGWQPGMTLKNIRIGMTNYSSAKILSTNPEKGTLALFLTRMGSRKRWEWSGLSVAVELHG